jgi:hypothetical protein
VGLRLLAILLFLHPIPSHAQSPDPATQELIQKLLDRIDKLEKRVAELEREKAAAGAAAPSATQPPAQQPPSAPAIPQPQQPPVPTVTQQPAPVQVQPVPAQHAHDQAPPSPTVGGPETAAPQYPFLKISGFGDVDFSATDLQAPAAHFQAQTLLTDHSGFELGQTTLHLISALSPKVSFFGEVTFTARSDAGTGTPPAPGFNLEVERLIIRYDFDDYFKLSFGRYHTPINYWNTAYHHGQWLQTSISRPEMVQFGGSFIPVHFIGALGQGEIPAGGLNLNYDVGVGNGRGDVISRGGDAGDINNNRAWLVNTYILPNWAYGLQLGGSVYRDDLNPLGLAPAREWIESAHVVWSKETPEVIAEFANVSHQPSNGGPVANSQAWYVQTAYRLPWFGKLFKPYYRLEQIHVPHSDYIFENYVPTFTGSTSGVRYDFSSFAAFKLEYRYYWRRDAPNFYGAFSQIAFTF